MNEKPIERKQQNDSKKKPVVVRVGMSPVEGNKNIGAIRSHLYNYSLAQSEKQKGFEGKVIFRVDDTNAEKHKKEKEKALELLHFFSDVLDFEFDITPENSQETIGQSVYQSERQAIYSKYVEELFDKKIAFVDKDSGLVLFDIKRFIDEYSDTLEFDDVLRGRILVDLEKRLKNSQNYFPLMRSDRSALYHLATVVDDAAFGVTHVVRGQDKIPIVDFQEMVRIALGFEPKKYLHTPLLLDEYGKMLGGASNFDDFIRKGILPQALVSYLISSGYGRSNVVYPSILQFLETFDMHKIHRANGKFDPKKLASLNKKLIKTITPDIYLSSVELYLAKNNEDALVQSLKSDEALQKLLISLRREPEEAVRMIQSILFPDFEKPDDDVRNALPSILREMGAHPDTFPSYDVLGSKKDTFFKAISWLLVGKQIFPDINTVYAYLKSRQMLQDRLKVAENTLTIRS